jgi:type IV pilus assembly protein PilP
MSRLVRFMTVGLMTLALGGCGDDGLDEVREFVKTAHADKKPRVEPLPEIKTQETVAYTATDLPDPFAAFNLKAQMAKGGGSGPRPDPNRRKEPLEDYPLDSLKMVGTLARGKQYFAILQAPDGTVHRAKVGDHMGQNFGMITKISEEKISLIELVQGALGDWTERETSVALVE